MADGGNGLVLADSAQVRAIATTTQGGSGGTHFTGQVGVAGEAVSISGGANLIEATSQSPRLEGPRVVRDLKGTVIDLTVEAETGAAVFLAASTQIQAQFSDPLFEAIAIPGSTPLIFVGTAPVSSIPGVGPVTLSVSVGALPPGVPALEFVLQAAVFGPSGALDVSNPKMISLVDDIF